MVILNECWQYGINDGIKYSQIILSNLHKKNCEYTPKKDQQKQQKNRQKAAGLKDIRHSIWWHLVNRYFEWITFGDFMLGLVGNKCHYICHCFVCPFFPQIIESKSSLLFRCFFLLWFSVWSIYSFAASLNYWNRCLVLSVETQYFRHVFRLNVPESNPLYFISRSYTKR